MKSDIKGVHLIPLEFYKTSKGKTIELWRHDWLLPENFPVMSYGSFVDPDLIAGPHEHNFQDDYMIFCGPGNFKLFLWEKVDENSHWDEDSVPYKETFMVGEDNPVAVIVPAGVVHAYQNVSNYQGLVLNAPNKLYKGPSKKYPADEVRYEEMKNNMFDF